MSLKAKQNIKKSKYLLEGEKCWTPMSPLDRQKNVEWRETGIMVRSREYTSKSSFILVHLQKGAGMQKSTVDFVVQWKCIIKESWFSFSCKLIVQHLSSRHLFVLHLSSRNLLIVCTASFFKAFFFVLNLSSRNVVIVCISSFRKASFFGCIFLQEIFLLFVPHLSEKHLSWAASFFKEPSYCLYCIFLQSIFLLFYCIFRQNIFSLYMLHLPSKHHHHLVCIDTSFKKHLLIPRHSNTEVF